MIGTTADRPKAVNIAALKGLYFVVLNFSDNVTTIQRTDSVVICPNHSLILFVCKNIHPTHHCFITSPQRHGLLLPLRTRLEVQSSSHARRRESKVKHTDKTAPDTHDDPQVIQLIPIPRRFYAHARKRMVRRTNGQTKHGAGEKRRKGEFIALRCGRVVVWQV